MICGKSVRKLVVLQRDCFNKKGNIMSINVTEARKLSKNANSVLQTERTRLATAKVLRRIESMARRGSLKTRVQVEKVCDQAVAANIAMLHFGVSLDRTMSKDNIDSSWLDIDWE